MTNPDRRIMSIARQVENIADLWPAFRAHMAAERVLADGYADHVTYAVEETTTERSAPLSGRCGANTVHGEVLIACGRLRPCGEHDEPVTLTPTERAAELALRLEREEADVRARLVVIERVANSIMADMTRLIGTRLAKPKRCTAEGREGSIEWGDPTCTSLPSRGPLCDRCSKAEYRWRVGRGLGRRADGVFSAEGVVA
jgi:hypothetical protein